FAFLPCCSERRRLPQAAVTHFESSSTAGATTRIEHRCRTCGDRGTADLFCSALLAHIVRTIPLRSFQFSKPAFFCHSFSRALLQANSCVRQLRGFCFPGSALTPMGSLR